MIDATVSTISGVGEGCGGWQQGPEPGAAE